MLGSSQGWHESLSGLQMSRIHVATINVLKTGLIIITTCEPRQRSNSRWFLGICITSRRSLNTDRVYTPITMVPTFLQEPQQQFLMLTPVYKHTRCTCWLLCLHAPMMLWWSPDPTLHHSLHYSDSLYITRRCARHTVQCTVSKNFD